MGKVIGRELCKKLKFNHTTKWYIHKSESILENELHKIPLDFEIQMDHLISARRSDQIINKKQKTCYIVDFAILVDQNENLRKQKEIQLLGLCQRTKMVWNISNGDTNYNWCVWKEGRKSWKLENKLRPLLRSARIVLETWGDLYHSDSSERSSANAGVKKLARNNNMNWFINGHLLLIRIQGFFA